MRLLTRPGILALALGAVAPVWPAAAQAPATHTYEDPAGRFSFAYPDAFGPPSRGTDDGFQGRAAAVRFQAVEGEAVLTTGPVLVDRQALGGLYDEIALQIFADRDRPLVASLMPRVTAGNFCDLLAAADHLSGVTLPPRLSAAAAQVDRFGNVNPVVRRCERDGAVIGFEKEVTIDAGTAAGRRLVSGAIRFLEGTYSSFQMVRVSPAETAGDTLRAMEELVRSFAPGQSASASRTRPRP